VALKAVARCPVAGEFHYGNDWPIRAACVNGDHSFIAAIENLAPEIMVNILGSLPLLRASSCSCESIGLFN